MESTSAAGVLESGDGELVRLVERAKCGDREAVEQLYLTHVDRIHGYLVRKVGNRHDAEDLTVQTFVRMLESIERFRFESAPFSAWLFRIAHNLAVDHFRSGQHCRPEAELPEPPGSEEPSAEEHVLNGFGRSSLLRALKMLPREQQQVLVLRVLWSFSNAETAEILNKSEGAVKALQHRALASLQHTAVPHAA
jgi:RNA polymerase sigma-70 factor, ECF subfamily